MLTVHLTLEKLQKCFIFFSTIILVIVPVSNVFFQLCYLLDDVANDRHYGPQPHFDGKP